MKIKKMFAVAMMLVLAVSFSAVIAVAAADERIIFDGSLSFTTDTEIGQGTYDKQYAGFKYLGSSTPYYGGGSFYTEIYRNEPTFLGLVDKWVKVSTLNCPIHTSANSQNTWYCGNHEVNSKYQEYKFSVRSNVLVSQGDTEPSLLYLSLIHISEPTRH